MLEFLAHFSSCFWLAINPKFICYNLKFICVILQGVKGAPYYVGSSQTLPRGMYSDRNKNIIGKFM